MRIAHHARVFDDWCKRVFTIAAVIALISALAWWDALAAQVGDSWAHALDSGTLGLVLFDTQFGRTWQWRLAIAALLLVIALWIRARRSRDLAITALAGVRCRARR